MKKVKRNNVSIVYYFILAILILVMVGSRLLNISLPIYAYGIIIGILLINLYLYVLHTDKSETAPINPVPEESRIDVLRNYAEYDLNKKEKSYSYRFQMDNRAPEILEKYNYSKYLKDVQPTSDELAFSLFDFVCDNFNHDGSVPFDHDRRIVDIIEACEANEGKTNCRGLSMILAGLLRINGIKARHVTCMPYEEPFEECHVVVDCLLPSGKRIMFDPTQKLYFKDSNGEYVSLEQFRKGVIEGDSFFENKEASYNGEEFNKDYYLEYMSKNLLRFSVGLIYEDVKNEWTLGEIELIPKDYPIENFPPKKEFVYNPMKFWSI